MALKRNWTNCVLFAMGMLLVQGQAIAQFNAYDTVINSGDSSNRVDMIIIGDGYTAGQINTDYVDHVNGTINHFFNNAGSAPLNRYKNFFNVHRVNIASNESGADKPNDNVYVDTALDASYSWGGNVERCLYFNTSKANMAVFNALSGTGIDMDDGMLLGTVNDSKYGGCGGSWGVYAGANSSAYEVATHEIGHSFANLADEYFSVGQDWTGGEFSQWNVTNNPNSGKWDRWVGYDDPDTNIGVIDYYEGGRYNETGVWRPSVNSKMRSLNRPFDAISREKFINDIYEEVDPLDDWLAIDDGAFVDELWVNTVDENVIDVEWFVDGQSVGIHGETLDLNSLGLVSGNYAISARGYDAILDHAFSGNSLDWWRLDGDHLQQTVNWNVSFSAVPEPGTGMLIGMTVGLLFCRRRRRT
ncbi:MAG: M64 family metallopeptidase [Planctomycetota bacterium]